MMSILLLLIGQLGWADSLTVVKDMRPAWMEYVGDSYQSATPASSLHTVYFHVNADAFKGQRFYLASSGDWDLFVNGKLIFTGHQHLFDLDSLAGVYSAKLFFGVHAPDGVADLVTQIASTTSRVARAPGISPRAPTFFRDYCIIISFFLLLFLLALLRTNPQLTLDYFSFAKIFSVQERNENLLASRITSSVNLLFYLFCALLTGFLLSSVFYFAGNYFPVARVLSFTSLGASLVAWLRLSLLILILLASKLTIVLIFSSLFNFRETVSFQFFNFLRFVLFTAVVMGGLSLLYFIFKGGRAVFYEQLIVLALVLLSAGSVMVLIKLLARSPFSFFHLFSYLCASEIIPLVIIIKIFF